MRTPVTRTTRLWLAPVLSALALVASATPALGLLLWTLTGGPLTATTGVQTTFTLTATNLDVLSELGCLEVDLPVSFTIVAAGAGNASNGDDWEAVVFGNKVAVHSLSGGGRLAVTESVTFTITAVPTAAGSFSWSNHAHRREDCTETEEIGVALGVVVLQGATVTPTPTPTPRPTPTPTPRPTPTPLPVTTPPPIAPPVATPPGVVVPNVTPRPQIPGGGPTASPTASPTPAAASSAQATATVAPSTTAPASPSALPATSPVAGGGPASGGETAPQGPPIIGVARLDATDRATAVSLGPLGVIDGMGVWVIPGAVVGGPGLLVMLWVVIQSGVAAAWMPAVRRLRGSDDETYSPGPRSLPT